MTPLHVIGIGLEGAAGLSPLVQEIVAQATLLVGSDRHLSYFPQHPARRIVLGDLSTVLEQVCQLVPENPCIVVLVSGDPLFFGLGRLLLTKFDPAQLTFHPHISAVQLAFSRIKVPWQDAQVVSAHGRSLEALVQALQQGADKIAVLTDTTNTPGAIAQLLLDLDLPTHYQFWVCENLGGPEERVQALAPATLVTYRFDPLNLVVLLRTSSAKPLSLETLPLLGLPDHAFLGFADRPGLMTKREVRVLALAELALQPGQVIWDLGAGTGAVAIEIARLVPQSNIYAVEKTAIGTTLIQQNCRRFKVKNVTSIHGSAPEVLPDLPDPQRVFIGGSGGSLSQILEACQTRLVSGGIIVLALATLEHLSNSLNWFSSHDWHCHISQVQIARSVAVGTLTRLAPLNPITLIKAVHS